MRCVTAAAISLLLAVPGIDRAVAEPTPYEAIRALERLQDRIATGDSVAQAAHAKAIHRTAQTFAAAKSGVWADKRNARALVLYLFSGGNAAGLERVIPRTAVSGDYVTLYEGALAYGLGRDDNARKILMPIDARSLPTGLGGHLALVQATLIASEDGAKAITLLDLARLLEPGTLVEEAALRKEMSLIGSTGDVEKFGLLARRYVGGFSRSIYAENFRQLVSQTALQLGSNDTESDANKLAKLMNGIERGERRKMYLAIAREAVLSGRMTMARLASVEAGKLSQTGEPDEARAMIYLGAATVAGPDRDLGLKALKSAAPDKVDSSDRDLRASALAVADMIQMPTSAATANHPNDERQAAILADGERSLQASEALLQDPTK